jgi:histidinol dehydrogenase
MDREAGAVVYPVWSRRSGGLSVGINLFPDRKICSFDCPYCEVFPFETALQFSIAAMERGLRTALQDAVARGDEVKDICFSGNGEPTLSPFFGLALEAAASLRDDLAPGAALVAITNGSTLADVAVAGILRRAILPRITGGLDMDLWVKLDAGTRSWYEKINGASLRFDALIDGIESFVTTSRVTVQTMLCAVAGTAPPAEEESAWIELAVRLAATGNVRRFHLYGKARPAPADPAAEALGPDILEARAAALRAALVFDGSVVPVQVFP